MSQTHSYNMGAMYHILIYYFRFLLPTLHIKMILEMPTNSQRREALEILPTDLYDSFQGIITRIQGRPNASAELGMRVLMWLHFACRPLKLMELQHALAVKRSHTEFDAGNIPSQKVLLDCCLGLVIVDEETLTVRFVHFTLEEYFRDNFRTQFPNGYSSIAETCLTYLNFGNLRQHFTDPASLRQMRTKYPFLKYAALYWGTYVKQQSSDGVTELVRMIVEHESGRPPCAIQALFLEIVSGRRLAQKTSGIHAVAYFGLSENIASFSNVELEDDDGRTPLSWAAEYGQEAVVRLLIERDGVEINAKDSEGKTALIWATQKGYEAIVGLLVERDGVEINAKDRFGKTALLWAAYYGHEAVVRLLIERDGVEINAKDEDENTPLIWAAYNGYEAVVGLLIERDSIEINAKDNTGGTALICVARKGNEAVVRLLVERDGVEINAKDRFGKTALICAAEKGHEVVVGLLIERDGVEINAKDNMGKTALIWAAERGHEAVVQLLIERGDVDINTKDKGENTPLIWAAFKGHEAVVRLLIERDGVKINAKDDMGMTALILAAYQGHEAVVRLLADRDSIEINAKDDTGKTALIWAAERGHEAIVQLLNNRLDVLARGSDIAPGSTLAGGVAGVEAEGVGGATAT